MITQTNGDSRKQFDLKMLSHIEELHRISFLIDQHVVYMEQLPCMGK
jgi:hypothetical protein